MKLTTKNRRRSRGVVIIIAMFFLMVLALLGSALIQLVPSEMFAAGRDRTDTAAHYASTSALKTASLWITAVQSPGAAKAGNTTSYDPYNLGDNWNDGTVATYGSLSYNRAAFDPFSVPAGDPNFTATTVSNLLTKMPLGYKANWANSLDMLGLADNKNLINQDFSGLSSAAANWPALICTNPLQIGPVKVFTFIVPDANTVQGLGGTTITGRRCYLLTTVAFIDTVPYLRTRAVMLETTYAKYAWFIDKNGTGPDGNPIPINIPANPDFVFSDGPFHMNDSPHIAVDNSYWNSVSSNNATHAFMGVLSYAGDNVTKSQLNPDYDNQLAWVNGNWNGVTNYNNTPFDSSGNPQVLTGAATGNGNRYDRLIEGGKPNLRRIASVSLPSDLTALQQSAFGNTTYTGLSTPTSVDPNQTSMSTTDTTVTIPGYYNSSGTYIPPSTQTPDTSKGAFVNVKKSTSTAIGGIAITGDMQAVSLDLMDKNGALSSDTTGATTVTNPVLRVQSNDATGWDTKVQIPIPGAYKSVPYAAGGVPYTAGAGKSYSAGSTGKNYSAGTTGAYTSGVKGAYSAGSKGSYTAGTTGKTYSAGSTGSYSAGTKGAYSGGTSKAAYSAAYNYTYTYTYTYIPGKSTFAAGYYDYTSPTGNTATATLKYAAGAAVTYSGSSGTPYTAGAGKAYSASTAVAYTGSTGVAYSGNPGVPYSASSGVPYTAGVATPYSAGATGTYSAGTNNYTAGVTIEPDTSAYQPRPFQPVDFVVQTTNTKMTIPQTMVESSSLWQNGPAAAGGSSINFNGLNVTTIVVHDQNGAVPAQTVGSSGFTVDIGKVAVFKQDRTDSTKLDVFIVDAPSKLNGVVFGTGNLDNLRGVNEGRQTIANDISNDKRISISDNLLQFGTAAGTNTTSASNGLGIVSSEVVLRTDDKKYANATTPSGNLNIYASIIAGSSLTTNKGGLDVSNPNIDKLDQKVTLGSYSYTVASSLGNNANGNMTANNTTDYGSATNPTFHIFGGLIEHYSKPTGLGNKGWLAASTFDPFLAALPPPGFPTSNSLAPTSFVQERLH